MLSNSINHPIIVKNSHMRGETFHTSWDIFLLLGAYLLTAPQISVYLPIYSDAVMLLCTTFLLFFIDRHYINQKSFGWLLLYSLIVILNFFAGDDYFSNYIHVFEETGLLLLPSALFYYTVKHDNVKLMKWIVLLFLVHTTYVTIASSVIEAIEPGSIRYTVVWSFYGEWNTINNYLRHGLSSYMFPHALPIVIPPLILGLKSNRFSKRIKFLMLLSLISTLYLIYLSSVATALLLAVLICIMSLMVKEDTLKNNFNIILSVGIVSLPILIILLNESVLLSILGFFSTIFDNTAFASKFVDMEQSLRLNAASGDIESRMSRYQITQDALAGNFIFGTNKPMGGHSALFDRLGALGFIGVVPYVIFLYLQIKLTQYFIPVKSIIYYAIGLFAGFVMLLTKNTNNWYLWSCMFLYMPLMTILFSSKHENREKNR